MSRTTGGIAGRRMSVMIGIARMGRAWESWTGRAGAPRGDLVLGAVLTALVVVMVAGQSAHPVVISELGAVAMTAPVVWRRRAPLAAASVVAAAALANGLTVGSVVRCGAAFPAVLLIAYSAGSRLALGRAIAGGWLCLVNVAAQSLWDPRLEGPSSLVVLVPFTIATWAVGREVRSRVAISATLRQRGAELRQRRDQTAALAIATDRVRIADELGGLVQGRIAGLVALAADAQDAGGTDPDGTRRTLGAIEHSGRETLAEMRQIVGTLRNDVPIEPQPTLAQLRALLDSATTAETRLVIDGDPRALPAGIELSAYRIVEHLLAALEDAPRARIEVHVRFGTDALELTVSGPPARTGEPSAVLAQVRERVSLHGGTLATTTASSELEARVRLPIVTAYT